MCFNIKISSNLKKTKKKPFFAFFCVPLKKKFKWPPIGHYRRLTPCTQLISKIMFQFFQNTCGSQRYLQKYGCQTPPKSVDPDLCPSKKLFFGHFFWENLSFDPFRHHLPPPMIYIVGKLWISRFMSSRPHTPEFNLYAVRFFVTLRESFHHRTSHSVIVIYLFIQLKTLAVINLI